MNKAISGANVRVDVARLVSMKKQAEAAAARSARMLSTADWAGDAMFSSAYPNLYALLAASLVDLDCDPGATLNIWLSPDGWVACLSPRWMGLKTFQASPTLEGLFEALEAFLTQEEPDWRSETGKRRPRAKAKSKGHKPS